MNAKESVENKENQVRYKKVGRRYEAVSTEFDTFGLEKGWYLVKIGDGCTSYRQQVRPNNAEADAAFRNAEDKMVEILREAHEARPTRKLTKKQLKDWNEIKQKHPDVFDMIQYDSLQGIAEKIIKEVRK